MKGGQGMTNRRRFLQLVSLLAYGNSAFGKIKKGETKMKQLLHKASSRGAANYGWLKSAHSFSFAHYYNPERMGFGLLRVLNDDFVSPGRGFDTHPHRDMEIVSIPLAGSLHHKDSEGNEQMIKHGEVQLMSAGTGVLHSEYNGSDSEDVNFLQIWVMPEKRGIKPRYDQQFFPKEERQNKFQTVVSPIGSNESGVKINQQAYFSLLDLGNDKSVNYKSKLAGNGLYVFVLEGQVKVSDYELSKRDALAISDNNEIKLEASSDAQILLIDVPLY